MTSKTINHPFGVLTDIDRGLTRFMSDLLHEAPTGFRPGLTIFEHEDRFVIEFDLPGVALDDVSLEVDDGVLQVSGERKRPELPEGSVIRFDERAWKPFQRRVRLDKSVDIGAIEADYRDGILVITAPRSPETRPHKVEIRRVTQSS